MCLSAEEAARIESDAMQKSAAEAERFVCLWTFTTGP